MHSVSVWMSVTELAIHPQTVITVWYR